MIHGSCVCGRVRYQVDGELEDFCHCHCSICRKIHGAAFASWGGILRDKFSWLAGGDEVSKYAFSDNADSVFCPNCSSTLLVDFKPEADMLYLAMGTVDGEVKCPPGFHQFVDSKAFWHDISDQLPQFGEWPDPQ